MAQKCPHCENVLTPREAAANLCPVCSQPLHGARSAARPASPPPVVTPAPTRSVEISAGQRALEVPLTSQIRPGFFFVPLAPQPQIVARARALVLMVCGPLLASLCLMGVLSTGAVQRFESEFLCIFFGAPLGVLLGCILSGVGMWSGRRLRVWIWLLGLPALSVVLSLALGPPLGIWALINFVGRQRNVERVLELSRHVDTQYRGDFRFAPARNSARSILRQHYGEIADRLRETNSPGRDEAFCSALATAIDKMAETRDPNLYLDVQETQDAADTPESLAELEVWSLDRDFILRDKAGKPDVIDPDFVFDDTYTSDRREMVADLFRKTLEKIADQRLVKLKLLTAADLPAGKPVLEIHVTYRIGPHYTKIQIGNAYHLLRNFDVHWEARLKDREEQPTAAFTTQTKPASLGLGGGSVNLYSFRRDIYKAMLNEAYGDFQKRLEAKVGVSAAGEPDAAR